MTKFAPSIFNDVIGPVMRGPSSSHCAAAARIGKLIYDAMEGRIDRVVVEFDPAGSLATTHESQGSDMGLFAGMMGWDITDERLADSREFMEAKGTQIEIKINYLEESHPNTYKISAPNKTCSHTFIAVSTGGGAIEIRAIDDFELSIKGDVFETLIISDHVLGYDLNSLEGNFNILRYHHNKGHLVQIRSQKELNDVSRITLKHLKQEIVIMKLKPVMPILTVGKIEVPFLSAQELFEYQKVKNLDLWELAMAYESVRGNISQEKVFGMMQDIVRVIQNSILEGLKGTTFENRILGNQSVLYRKALKNKKLLDGGMLNQMILYISALMEMKSSMGVFVAAPTAGSCGGLPGAIVGAAEFMGLGSEEMTKAMLSAGLIGVFIAHNSTFAAEECGCQAECGAGSGMAAAGLVTLSGGDLKQAINASSMALQNVFGMTCDPVANRVEVPCLGKNIMEAANALSCANMALAGYDPVIPFDEVIDSMDKVGRSLPRELRCTALGGLSITKTSKTIEKNLQKIKID